MMGVPWMFFLEGFVLEDLRSGGVVLFMLERRKRRFFSLFRWSIGSEEGVQASCTVR